MSGVIANRRIAVALAVATLLGLALTATISPDRAGAAPASADSLAAGVRDALAIVREAGSTVTSATVAADVAWRVEEILPLNREVVEGTATIVVADTRVVHDLTGRLRTATNELARTEAADALEAHLVSMEAALGRPGTVPWDAAALRELIAARPVTTDRGGSWLADQIDRILERIARWLADVFGGVGVGGALGSSRLFAALVVAVPVAIALVILYRALRRRRRGARAAAEAALGSGAPVVAAAADLPEDALSFARSLAADGRHRDAVRALYGGAARHLVRSGLVAHARTRTNREMLRDVSTAAPGIAPAFGQLTDEFEVAWYGHADPGGDGFVDACRTYEALVERAEGTVPAPNASNGGDAR